MINSVTIRMYNMGFGDCFLLGFQTSTGSGASKSTSTKWVLIDCGTITEGKSRLSAVVDDIVQTIKDDNGARLELVVGTHRHKDHVGGFAANVWDSIDVGEVWMPWTEDPDDPVATRIRNRQSSFALALAGGASDDDPLAKDANGNPPDVRGADWEALSAKAMALNALSNVDAMATLHRGFKGTQERIFLPLKDKPYEIRNVAGLDGVKFHVVGPPRDEKFLKIMDPPAGAGYLRARAQQGAAADADCAAFDQGWWITESKFRTANRGSTLSAADIKKVRAMAEQPINQLAAAIDKAVNNTSLVFVIEVGKQWLLFCGDAQWGSWDAAMSNQDARAALSRSTFLKVGHHGSHNATPRTLIENLLKKNFTAVFSTCHVKQWPSIPKAELVKAVVSKAKRVAVSNDDDATTAAGFRVQPGLYSEVTLNPQKPYT